MERTLKAVHGSLAVTVPADLTRALGWRKGDRIRFVADGPHLRLSLASPATPNLTTVGYEGKDAVTFIRGLKEEGIEILVDVRDLPLSRRKGFSKTALSESLGEVGIEYEHLKALGAPKPVRDPFKESGYRDAVRFRRDYERHLADQEAALDRLKTIARRKSAAIMCFEANHALCHRSIVADAVARDGFRIVHA